MSEDRCAWFRCSRDVVIIYGACQDKRGSSINIPLCDYHWGKIAELGSAGAAKILQQNVPSVQIERSSCAGE